MSNAEFEYGPDIPGETELRLLGPVAGKRPLVLGGRRTDAIHSLARNDTKVIVVDDSASRSGVKSACAIRIAPPACDSTPALAN